MTKMASQITSLAVVYSTVYSDADQIKHQSSVSLAFVWRIHRDRWILRTKGQLRGKCFHLMTSSCCQPKALYACTEFWVISCLWKKSLKCKTVFVVTDNHMIHCLPRCNDYNQYSPHDPKSTSKTDTRFDANFVVSGGIKTQRVSSTTTFGFRCKGLHFGHWENVSQINVHVHLNST